MRNSVSLLCIMAFMLMFFLTTANSEVLSSANSSNQFQRDKNTGNNVFARNSNRVLLLNVGGELMYATRDTLTYIPNTILASIFTNNINNNQSSLIQRDNNGKIFLDLPPTLFKHALEEIRRWKNRANRSADQQIKPPSWSVKKEFDEMLVSLGLGKYRQSLPVECTSYNVSGDATRRVGSGKGNLCDRDMMGWIRFVDRAGTAIVRTVPTGRCGGLESGWVLGVYPTQPGTTTLSTLCYVDEIGNPCSSSKPIRTTHCGDFLVFELVAPPNCPARACTEDYHFN